MPALIAAVAMAAGQGSTASAQPGSLGEFLFGQPNAAASPPPVARYVIERGQSFIFDRSTGTPLIQFEDSKEVWVLTRLHGPRGDTIYENEAGEPVLKVTSLGGVTVFTERRPEGIAVSLSGPAPPITSLQLLGFNTASLKLNKASSDVSRALRRQIEFDASRLDADDPKVRITERELALLADAAAVAAEALIEIGQRPGGRARLARINKVVFTVTPRRPATAVVREDALHLNLMPGVGFLGRASSRRIAAAFGR